MADIRIKDIEQVAAIKDTMKVPVGNAGDDKSYTATFKQIRDYTKQDLTGYVTNTQLDSKGYTTMQDVENKGYITMDNVGNGALTLNVNGVKKTFTANQSEDLTIEINSFKPNNGRLVLKIKDKEYIFTADQEKDIIVDIPAGEGSADWSEITNKPTFAAVATSGSYTDLSSKPTIPSKVSQLTNDSNFITNNAVGNATITIFQGGVKKGSFSVNQKDDLQIDLADGSAGDGAVRFDVSQRLTEEQRKQALENIGAGRSNFSGSYTDLTNKPTIPSNKTELVFTMSDGTTKTINVYTE